MATNPADILYSTSHEWTRIEGDEAVIGITSFAQESLGDITYVELPPVGDQLSEDKEFGSVESVKGRQRPDFSRFGRSDSRERSPGKHPRALQQRPLWRGLDCARQAGPQARRSAGRGGL